MLVPMRGRGRPRAKEPRSSVTAWVLAKHHDALIHLASERSMSVSAVLRSLITTAVKKDKPKRSDTI